MRPRARFVFIVCLLLQVTYRAGNARLPHEKPYNNAQSCVILMFTVPCSVRFNSKIALRGIILNLYQALVRFFRTKRTLLDCAVAGRDREDINSVCLTVVAQLLEKYDIPKDQIGRIEVLYCVRSFYGTAVCCSYAGRPFCFCFCFLVS